MALRKIISKTVFPTLERELNSSIGKEVAAMEEFFGGPNAQTTFGYKTVSGHPSGAYAGTAVRNAPRLVRVDYTPPPKGLFQDQVQCVP